MTSSATTSQETTMTTVTVAPEKLAILDTLAINKSAHESFDQGHCAMELVAWLAGEPHSDAPACACPVISRAVIRLNDRMPSDEMRAELLRPLLPRIVGSRSTRVVQVKRAYIAADMACRVFAPMALEARGKLDLAAGLRALAPITDTETAKAAKEKCRAAAAAAAYAAYAAAAAAAYAAADDAYAAAAYDAAAAAAADAAARKQVFTEGVRMIGVMLDVRE